MPPLLGLKPCLKKGCGGREMIKAMTLVVTKDCKPLHWEGWGERCLELEVSLDMWSILIQLRPWARHCLRKKSPPVEGASARTTRAVVQRNPVSKTTKLNYKCLFFLIQQQLSLLDTQSGTMSHNSWYADTTVYEYCAGVSTNTAHTVIGNISVTTRTELTTGQCYSRKTEPKCMSVWRLIG